MKRTLLTLLLALLLTACGPANTDPRKGRVTLDEEGCWVGGCYELYEFCIGPDLHVIYDESGDDDYRRTFINDKECAP